MLKKNILFITLLLGFTVLITTPAYGQGDILPTASGTTSEKTCKNPATHSYDATYCGDYALDDFVRLAINVSKWILGIVGSLSLVMFIYGGFMFLISAGSADTIGKAKKILIAAVIGLVIVFSSYLIIKFVLASIGLKWDGTKEVPKLTSQTINLIIKNDAQT